MPAGGSLGASSVPIDPKLRPKSEQIVNYSIDKFPLQAMHLQTERDRESVAVWSVKFFERLVFDLSALGRIEACGALQVAKWASPRKRARD